MAAGAASSPRSHAGSIAPQAGAPAGVCIYPVGAASWPRWGAGSIALQASAPAKYRLADFMSGAIPEWITGYYRNVLNASA